MSWFCYCGTVGITGQWCFPRTKIQPSNTDISPVERQLSTSVWNQIQ